MVLFFVLTHCNCICVQDTLVYSLVPKEPETSFFFLHPATGVITLAKRLTVEGDAERKTEYRVNIQVLLILINLTLFIMLPTIIIGLMVHLHCQRRTRTRIPFLHRKRE